MDNEKLTVVKELHRQARKNYPRRKVQMRGIDETWQADLVEMIPYSYSNKGFKYMLTVIDIFSKYAWAVAVKSKNGKDISLAMKTILKQGRIPKNLHTDRGKEFYNSEFKSLMQEFNINLYSTYTYKAINYKWINLLPTLISKYNNKKHRTIGIKPKDVTVEDTRELLRRIRYTPNWTTEIFTVDQVKSTKLVTYKLKDYQNQPIEGGFYEEELVKVQYPDVYLVEKVLKTRGNDVYVKWLGFDSSHNSWIKKSDM
ncbi:uncharacterized protein LOC122506316 [Leptopilina heterotoma]|uniref:uncharacterized protein LOC122506316 n=1 Tax=Leptopilina heterotoma TaxID=63436 RepID=UPI001CA9C845|nr:uncharacterized protein LOC122506316 [Leptopilina heterotoma]